eukprot:13009604-Alexandrium_andersonii.AAC.1
MSASLVGSEMCIRDRRELRGTEGPPSGAFAFQSMEQVGHAGGHARMLMPVSYRHLRLPTICSV